MTHKTTVLFRSRILGFVPGWLALILVLGSTAVALPPVFNGDIVVPANTTTSNVVAMQTSSPTAQQSQNQYIDALVIGTNKLDSNHGNTWLGAEQQFNLDENGTPVNSENTCIGTRACSAFGGALSSSFNTAVGHNACGFGAGAGAANGGQADICIGEDAGRNFTGGTANNDNVVIGANTGRSLAVCCQTMVGFQAGYTNATGDNNTFFGYESGYFETGNENTFLGSLAGYNAAAQNHSVLIGYRTGYNATNACNTTMVGYQAGFHDVTGCADVLLGYQAGFNETGGSNTLIGFQAGTNITSGNNNVIVGNDAGLNVTGSGNTILGNCDSTTCQNGATSLSTSVIIGSDMAPPSATASGQLDIQEAIYGVGNTGANGTLSTGCILVYNRATTCPSGVKFGVANGAIQAPSGSATSCTGGHTFDNGIMVISGAGAPTCTAPAASEYLRSDGASGSHIYISQGSGTWTAISGV